MHRKSSWLLSLALILSENVIKLVVATGNDTTPAAGSPPSCNHTCDFIEYGIDAYCNNRNLTVVPHDCGHIVFLDMRGNVLRRIHRGDFYDFTSLKYLDLSQNVLEKLGSGTFAGARLLLDIYLFKNQLYHIHHDAFSETGSIRSIYLSKNNIPDLPPTALRGLPHLEVFFMSYNQLHHISRHQFKFNMELTHVGFSYNRLELIQPETFKHLSKLVYLDLSHNNLIYIESSVFTSLRSLETLKIVNNSLESDAITYDLLRAGNLEIIDLSSNQIKTIPPGVDRSGLGKLRLADNPLVCDCAFSDLQTLYIEKFFSAVDEKGEDWQWVMDVNCSDGNPLIDVSITCPTTTGYTPANDTPATQGMFLSHSDSHFMTPVVIIAVVISTICLLICLYVTVSWIRACDREDTYRKASLSEVKKVAVEV